jgi:RND family efflux transporter MFP subunit
MEMKKSLLVGLLVGAFAFGLFFAKRHSEKEVHATTTSPAVAVDLTTPKRCTLRRVVEVFGSLSPKTTTDVKSEVPGRISKVEVKEWDHVKNKNVLLEIDPTDLELALNRNVAGLKMAQAQLIQARVDLNRAKREWNRALKLKEGGLITGQELDDRQTALELADAKVKLAEAQIGQAESQLAESRHNLEKARICAPIEGTVSQRAVDVGDFVDKGALLFKIVDNRVLDFTATVPATDLSYVTEGQLLDFTVDGLPGQTFRGRIKRVNPLVRSTDRSGRILAEVENTDGSLRGGLFARGQVVIEERKDCMVLPRAALMGWNVEKATARIFVVDDEGIARSRPVVTGLTDSDMVEIRSGLCETDRTVVRGGFNLREGDRTMAVAQESSGSG